MNFLGVDVGTTHCKAGVFDARGHALRIATRPTPTQHADGGRPFYEPEILWQTLLSAIREVASGDVQAVGVTSMAETGILLDRNTKTPRSDFLPWFDTCATPQAERLGQHSYERFGRTGIRANFKCGLAKLLWLREQSVQLEDGVWLSAADYVVYRLAGTFTTDYSLAGRTYAFDILNKAWDTEFLETLHLSADLFPKAEFAGTTAGELTCAEAGLPMGVPVAIAGHDHLCAAFAVGAVEQGGVFDSAGTAESLVGTLDTVELNPAAFDSGLSYGCHVAPERYYWMGGISASGGSVEWLRAQLGDLSYEQTRSLLETLDGEPTGILYYPYLSGSGIPRPDSAVRAAFIGLSKSHQRGHMLKAVMEGAAFELETIRRAAETATGQPVRSITSVGGGTRIPQWAQIKADITGCVFYVPAVEEAALLGAALLAARGAGYSMSVEHDTSVVFSPHTAHHQRYRELYEQGYLRLQSPLEQFYRSMKS
jgi:sugar (pentulose or hexulose) kinase